MSERIRWIAGGIGPAKGLWRLVAEPSLRLPPREDWLAFTRGPHSALFRVGDDSGVLAKLIYPRSQPRDSLRKYANAQAKREWRSAFRLRAAGLQTPAARGWAVSLSPFCAYESILFMDEIVGFETGLRFIRESKDSIARERLLGVLAADMARLHGHGLIHKDGHFGNIGRDGSHALIWIDNDIRQARSSRALTDGFAHMRQMLRRTARDDVSASEWRFFDDRLRHELEKWPRAHVLLPYL